MRIVVSLLAMITLAQEPQNIGKDVVPPKVLHKAEPSYTDEARHAHLQGMVRLKCVVTVAGVAEKCGVQTSLGLGLDEKALEAISKWRFTPGQKNGTPVPVYATIDVNFRIDASPGGWHSTSAHYGLTQDMKAPHLKHVEYPKVKSVGRVALTFTVNEHGQPREIVAESGDVSVEDLVANLAKWRFDPALKDGKPVAVHAVFEFD